METKFRAEISELSQILAWIRGQLDQTELVDKEKKRVELAMEEAIVNVITHGKPAEITLLYRNEQPDQVEFILKDDGPPFNPITDDDEEALKLDATLEEREPGGLGLSIMRKYMDLLLYRREENHNILTLIKVIGYSPQGSKW
jgi:anti-sigma regulatory factor (Ser/Thr protein kinase)